MLQLLQALQGFGAGPDEATQLDASLQGGARAQFGRGPGQLLQQGLPGAGHDVCVGERGRGGRPLRRLEPRCSSLTVLWAGGRGLRGRPRARGGVQGRGELVLPSLGEGSLGIQS